MNTCEKADKTKPLPTVWKVPDDLWALIEKLLAVYDPPARTGRPRMNQRQALDGILYRARTGCQWNQLPKEFGDDVSVHRTMQRWERLSLFDIVWAVLVTKSDIFGSVQWDWQAADCALGKARGIGKKGSRKTPNKDGVTQKSASARTPPTVASKGSRRACLSKAAAVHWASVSPVPTSPTPTC